MTMADAGLPAGTTPETTAATTGITLPDGTVITPEEAAAGYMRQSAFTQKTQDVANQRRLAERGLNLLAALDQDPAAAIDLMARTYNIASPTPTAPTPAAQGQTDEWGVPIAPTGDSPETVALKSQIATLQGQIGSVSQNQQRTQLMNEINASEALHGDTFDREIVLRHMQANNIPTVEMAYRDLNWDTANADHLTLEQQRAEQAKVLASKRGLSGVVASGAGVASGQVVSTNVANDYEGGSWRENLRAALHDSMEEQNISNLGDPVLLEG